MARKTIDVAAVTQICNGMLAYSQDDMVAEREAIAMVAERVLMDTGNYHGFGYTSKAWRWAYSDAGAWLTANPAMPDCDHPGESQRTVTETRRPGCSGAVCKLCGCERALTGDETRRAYYY